MDANQRSEVNNQTNNGANEKGTPGAKGNTKPDAPLDHTYPKGATQQQGVMPGSEMGTPQSGAGPEIFDATSAGESGKLQGGSMQTQQTGGTGAQQGVTDSHQRAMEQRSPAYGKLEQPVGGRPRDSGVSLQGQRQSGNTQATAGMNPQNAAQPELRNGSGNMQSTQGGGQHGPLTQLPRNQGGSMGQQSASSQGTQGGGQAGPQSDASSMQRGGSMGQQFSPQQGTQGAGQTSGSSVKPGGSLHSTDRKGSQTDTRSESPDVGALESNDLSGGLPRSPGNSGPRPDQLSTHQTGPDNRADMQRVEGVHESNDAAGGLPRSPGGANKLAADQKMDDDTGFSNPRRR